MQKCFQKNRKANILEGAVNQRIKLFFIRKKILYFKYKFQFNINFYVSLFGKVLINSQALYQVILEFSQSINLTKIFEFIPQPFVKLIFITLILGLLESQQCGNQIMEQYIPNNIAPQLSQMGVNILIPLCYSYQYGVKANYGGSNILFYLISPFVKLKLYASLFYEVQINTKYSPDNNNQTLGQQATESIGALRDLNCQSKLISYD
ncbi:hypothetical protein pb186bvf_000292 [Paramecium bursaria]